MIDLSFIINRNIVSKEVKKEEKQKRSYFKPTRYSSVFKDKSYTSSFIKDEDYL